jgi:hypothetical protein
MAVLVATAGPDVFDTIFGSLLKGEERVIKRDKIKREGRKKAPTNQSTLHMRISRYPTTPFGRNERQ